MPKTRRQQNSTTDNSNESIDENNVGNSVELNEVSDSSAISNSTEEGPSQKAVSPSKECCWMVGQLAWARVGNFPFWPCVVTLDPVSMSYHKLKGKL